MSECFLFRNMFCFSILLINDDNNFFGTSHTSINTHY